MVTFLDGPAKDVSLNLQRAPLLLRVVIDGDCTVDALDQLSDEPKPSERIYVYRLAEPVSRWTACGRWHGCRRSLSAKYRLHAEQPTDVQARHSDEWRVWAQGQAEHIQGPRLGDAGPFELMNSVTGSQGNIAP